MSTAVRVLLVDDDEDEFAITREMLSETRTGKFEIDWAATIEAGLSAMAEKRPDVCLVDYRMGEHNGLDFMRRVFEAGFDVPMVMLTGHGDQHVDSEAMRIGAADYLVKGEVQPSLLERTLRHAMHRASERKPSDAELIRARDAAMETARLRGEYLATMNRENRTPITGIIRALARNRGSQH